MNTDTISLIFFSLFFFISFFLSLLIFFWGGSGVMESPGFASVICIVVNLFENKFSDLWLYISRPVHRMYVYISDIDFVLRRTVCSGSHQPRHLRRRLSCHHPTRVDLQPCVAQGREPDTFHLHFN